MDFGNFENLREATDNFVCVCGRQATACQASGGVPPAIAGEGPSGWSSRWPRRPRRSREGTKDLGHHTKGLQEHKSRTLQLQWCPGQQGIAQMPLTSNI